MSRNLDKCARLRALIDTISSQMDKIIISKKPAQQDSKALWQARRSQISTGMQHVLQMTNKILRMPRSGTLSGLQQVISQWSDAVVKNCILYSVEFSEIVGHLRDKLQCLTLLVSRRKMIEGRTIMLFIAISVLVISKISAYYHTRGALRHVSDQTRAPESSDQLEIDRSADSYAVRGEQFQQEPLDSSPTISTRKSDVDSSRNDSENDGYVHESTQLSSRLDVLMAALSSRDSANIIVEEYRKVIEDQRRLGLDTSR